MPGRTHKLRVRRSCEASRAPHGARVEGSGNSPKPPARPPRRVNFITDLSRVSGIPEEDRRRLEAVTDQYAFLVNDYYLGLIDWDDPDDPIRQLVIPKVEEMQEWGALDASSESAVTVARGVQHKYATTALLLVTQSCASYCRYCFRKRFFMPGNQETSTDVSEGLDYIAGNPDVRDVLLTGGDPLMLSTDRLVSIIEELRAIPHVNLIRIGSKMPAFNPWRILDDKHLLEALRGYSSADTRIYLMSHFDHPRELTEPALEAIERMVRSGVVCLNQCPLVRGINADPEVLVELFHTLATAGCAPYYIFQVRPTSGNAPYAVPILEGLDILSKAGEKLSGLAKRARYVMSHATGKIEILGTDEDYLYMRFHRAKELSDGGRLLVFQRDETAHWLDDLEPAFETGVVSGRG